MNKNILMPLIAVLIFIGAAYLIYQYALPNLHAEGEAEKLYLKALKIGDNASDYKYVYREITNDYQTQTSLVKIGENKQVKMSNPVMDRTIYFTTADTFLCVDFRVQSNCSSVKNETILGPFLYLTQGLFFDSENIKKELENFELLKTKKAIKFEETITDKKIDENECKEVKFTIDYSDLTVSDLSKMGISQNDPKKYDGSFCVGNDGTVYEKTFKYNYLGVESQNQFKLLEANWNYEGEIKIPQNLSQPSKVIDLLYDATDLQKEISVCIVKTNTKYSCLFTIALREGSIKICDLTGPKREFCYENIALQKDDLNICSLIGDNSVKDDCYIEFGAARKKTDSCNLILNGTKKDICIEVANKIEVKKNATIIPEQPEENVTSNISKEEQEQIDKILNELNKN